MEDAPHPRHPSISLPEAKGVEPASAPNAPELKLESTRGLSPAVERSKRPEFTSRPGRQQGISHPDRQQAQDHPESSPQAPKSKPAALKLETARDVQPVGKSPYLVLFQNARSIRSLSNIDYPAGLMGPNPDINRGLPFGEIR